MTPTLRSKMEGLRDVLGTALARLDEVLGTPDETTTLKTPAAIVAVLQRSGRVMSPSDIHGLLVAAGRDVAVAAVLQACKRLADAGKIERLGWGTYRAKAGAS